MADLVTVQTSSLAIEQEEEEGHCHMRETTCQEGLSCVGGKASYFCQECGTYQCEACQANLHSSRGLQKHSRTRLGSEGERVCELWCSPKALVSVYCQQCGMEMCRVCDVRMHQGGRKDHVREEMWPKKKSSPGQTAAPETSSFLLVDDMEQIMVTGPEEFLRLLGCQQRAKVKVVSIFGNTGDGKSHTLNHAFFQGKEVFGTSPQQASCTVGVWAAHSPQHRAIVLDTEGLLGVSHNENRRTRLLLKVLAISDIIIYRTRAERLHNDLFTFLGDASDAYWKYFSPELRTASQRCRMSVPLSTLGPSVVLFHETQHTDPLGVGRGGGGGGGGGRGHAARPHPNTSQVATTISAAMRESSPSLAAEEGTEDSPTCSAAPAPGRGAPDASLPMSAEELLRIRFAELGRIPKAFCSVEYVGTRTRCLPTDFSALQKSVWNLLQNNAVRAPRNPDIVLTALQVLNEKFSGDIEAPHTTSFPDAYFTCDKRCLVCGTRCELSMNHWNDRVKHKITGARCQYSHHYDNKIQLCKTCFDRGVESVVVPQTSTSADTGWTGLAKYTWSGYVLECSNCGVIYRSRQYWYGNKNPEHTVVKTENKHVWPEDLPPGVQSSNMARRILDTVGSAACTVSSVSAVPTKMVSSWVADQLSPSYWVPNSKIKECGVCKREFNSSETKHHCRACGGGFCESCSSRALPVPWRGWGNSPVRVCDSCYELYHQGEGGGHGGAEETLSEQSGVSSRAPEAVSTPSQGREGVTVRCIGEAVQSAVGVVVGVMRYPKGKVVESARPEYWVPDEEITQCHKCMQQVGDGVGVGGKHHCRACGQGFCDKCSEQRLVVPSRGWEYPVRVCDDCAKKKEL